ncbi:MAG: hypothetical protein ACI9K1_001691, partial [Arcticibacterium sp.]
GFMLRVRNYNGAKLYGVWRKERAKSRKARC